MELYKKHRPKTLKRIFGQRSAVGILQSMIQDKTIPHALLFSGPSGCGKTTLARILKKHLNCHDRDFTEMNCASFRGIDAIRSIENEMRLSPFGDGSCKIYLLDESHKLTNDAQSAALNMLEDTPGHVYFMLATTHPTKLLPTIRTRCTDIKVSELSHSDAQKMVEFVAKREKKMLSEEVIESIVEHGYGSARKCLVLLDQIMGIENEEEQLDCIVKSDDKVLSIELARALIKPNASWQEVAGILKNLEDDVESLRWMIMMYAKAVLLKGGVLAPRAYLIIDAFRDNFYDSKSAGLIAACYEVVQGSK